MDELSILYQALPSLNNQMRAKSFINLVLRAIDSRLIIDFDENGLASWSNMQDVDDNIMLLLNQTYRTEEEDVKKELKKIANLALRDMAWRVDYHNVGDNFVLEKFQHESSDDDQGMEVDLSFDAAHASHRQAGTPPHEDHEDPAIDAPAGPVDAPVGPVDAPAGPVDAPAARPQASDWGPRLRSRHRAVSPPQPPNPPPVPSPVLGAASSPHLFRSPKHLSAPLRPPAPPRSCVRPLPQGPPLASDPVVDLFLLPNHLVDHLVVLLGPAPPPSSAPAPPPPPLPPPSPSAPAPPPPPPAPPPSSPPAPLSVLLESRPCCLLLLAQGALAQNCRMMIFMLI